MDEFKTTGDYRYSEKSTATTAVTFLLVGLGIGAVVALLLAPKTGKQIRKQLRRKYEDARDCVEELSGRASDYWEKSADWASEQKDRVAPIVKKLRRT